MNNQTAQDLASLATQGYQIATSYKAGDKFLGAWGECARLNIVGRLERAIFTECYLFALHRRAEPIRCDWNNIILD